ncbi:MAG TPA: D-glucuronyl C5-epimerase family protein [Alphaproteobacteria bacterium]|nr:D-glucuronyl C5-epimerase family protein [Alphaproteobacteria bacterium]
MSVKNLLNVSLMRSLLELVLYKNSYFHQPHTADENAENPKESFYYNLRGRLYYPGAFKNGLPIVYYGGLAFIHPVNVAYYGLAHLQYYWDTGESEYLTKALHISRTMVEAGEEDQDGLVWRYPILLQGTHNWISAMAQGLLASLLLRVGLLVDDEWCLSKANLALKPFLRVIPDGGVQTSLDGNIWFEEYALPCPSYTLNGFIVALLAVRDGALLLGEKNYFFLYEEALNTLENTLARFDLRGWSRYDLITANWGRLKITNMASPFYHRFHIELLTILQKLTGRASFSAWRGRWESGLKSGMIFYRAIAEKVLFRLLMPVTKTMVY